jgi:hypothetical protein
VLDGLPPYGLSAVPFSATGLGTHAEGLVVEFSTNEGTHSIGNFVRGLTSLNLLKEHPNGTHVVIIAGGQGYVIEPNSMRLVETFGGAVVSAESHPSRNWLIMNFTNLSFAALGPDGWAWKSKRVSWDGMRKLRIVDGFIYGEGWRPGDTWVPFSVDPDTGAVSGGSYSDK